jgi:hypothetical protein
MKRLITILAGILILSAAASAIEPHISYVYPAGGQCGETVDILIGGQGLRGPQAVYISDNSAKPFIIEYIPPLRPLRDEDRTMFRKRLAAIQKELRENGNEPLSEEEAQKLHEQFDDYPKNSKLNHPMLRELETLNPVELQEVAKQAFGAKRPDAQLAESTSIKLNIKANTKPGTYQIRLLTASGLSNPLNFQIDKLPERNEREPNDKQDYLEAASLPVVFNGQIMPGDIDRHCFSGKKGEKLVIEAHARSLKPYMADAVPGWFQAVIALFDDKGKELAFCDDYMFDPDPVIFFEVPQTGTYQVQIRDSIYRGREDFVYRISVAERPFIKSMFPLGANADSTIEVELDGWNLTQSKAAINEQGSGRSKIKYLQVNNEELYSNSVPYRLDPLNEVMEQNDSSAKSPQEVPLGTTVNGRIETAGESDYFAFEGKKDQQIVVEVNARSLRSPLDAAIELIDGSGKTIAFNDDYKNRALGLQTHHADPYLMTALPESGRYIIRIFDVTAAGGKEYGYRLRISQPMPSYELRMTPSSIALLPGQSAAVKIDVLSKDGFNEDILLGLRTFPKAGYTLRGDRIPAGRESMYVTITAPPNLKKASELMIESRSRTAEGIISSTAIPAENMMQAFIYYQLVPSSEMLAAKPDIRWKVPAFRTDTEKLTLSPGASAKISFINQNPGNLSDKEMTAELLGDNPHIKISDINTTKDTVELTITTDKDCPTDCIENLVAKLSMHTQTKGKGGETRKVTVELNSLPAVAIEINDNKNKDTNDKVL